MVFSHEKTLTLQKQHTRMGTSELKILIGVFVLLAVILVWMSAKLILDMRRRKQQREQRRKDFMERMTSRRGRGAVEP
jgi:membrane protein implicated in regulation of membrane protease activity